MWSSTAASPLPMKHRRINSDLALKTFKSKKLIMERQAFNGTVEGYPVQLVDKYLTQTTINGRYQIVEFLDKGSYGQVLSLKDLEKPRAEQVVIKVMTSYCEFIEEEKVMQRIFRYAAKAQPQWRQEKCPVPRVVSSGFLVQLKLQEEDKLKFTFEKYQEQNQMAKWTVADLKKVGKVNPYIIMPRYQVNLSDCFVDKDYDFSIPTILDLARRVVEQLRIVHRAGYVYNDLKPDNIMLERKPLPSEEAPEVSSFRNVALFLIDFGFCTKYKDRETGVLYHCENIKKFRGNLRYSSADQLDFYSTGRKDDMISLCYILVYMLNRGKFLDTEEAPNYKNMDSLGKMKWARARKRAMTPQTLCSGRAQVLLPFAEKVFELGFYDKPNYDELAHLLQPPTKEPKERKHQYFSASAYGFRGKTAPQSPLKLPLHSPPPQVSSPISPQLSPIGSPQMSPEPSPHTSPVTSPLRLRKPPHTRLSKHESHMKLRTFNPPMSPMSPSGLSEREGESRNEIRTFSNALTPQKKYSSTQSKISLASPRANKRTKPQMASKTTKKVQITLPIIISDAQRATIALNSPKTQPIKPKGHRSTFSLDGGMQLFGSIFH